MKCDYFASGKCRSCNLLDRSYGESLLVKENELREFFPDQVEVMQPTVKVAGEIGGSRNKAKLAVFDHEGKLTFGFYHSDGSYQELEQCPLHVVGINQVLAGLRDILNQFAIVPYDLKTKSGELKYLLISASGVGDAAELLLRFVLRSKKTLSRFEKALPEILAVSSLIKVVSVNIQPVHQAVLEGDEEIVLTDEKYITHQFDEFELTLGTRSFFQVTSEIALGLYNAVADEVKVDAPSSLLDLYCGVGAFSFFATRYCVDVVGVEISQEAIKCARISAGFNRKDVTFLAMDVEKYLGECGREFDVVLVNPPRRGLNADILGMIVKMAPRVIYYSSCNVKTLRRDFEVVREFYQVRSLRVFDMFPFTGHFETLMCLVRV
jgi:23S rRNA (uracil747-C5)-methyltransferase